ncbi:hypothetical protein RFI_12189, partial [Reticulomyxa filosa]
SAVNETRENKAEISPTNNSSTVTRGITSPIGTLTNDGVGGLSVVIQTPSPIESTAEGDEMEDKDKRDKLLGIEQDGINPRAILATPLPSDKPKKHLLGILARLSKGVQMTSHRASIWSKKEMTSGMAIVTWIENNVDGIRTRAGAVQIAQQMYQHGMIKSVKSGKKKFLDSSDEFYKFVDVPSIDGDSVISFPDSTFPPSHKDSVTPNVSKDAESTVKSEVCFLSF